MRNRHFWLAVLFLAAQLLLQAVGQSEPRAVALPTDGKLDDRAFFATRRHPAVDYDAPATDGVAQLIREVEQGTVNLRFQGSGGYLRSLLEALNVPASSQSVVFSKTSLQGHYISPSNPRALYFSDDVIVGFIRNTPIIEIAAHDPRHGMVFYTVTQAVTAEGPQIVRADLCLSCHETRETLGVPGLLARSFAVGSGGETLRGAARFTSDHRSPFEERWGGWFITGGTGRAHHMGNTFSTGDGGASRTATLPPQLQTLEGTFDPDGYVSLESDVAAVMTLNHQVRMANLMTRVSYETRIAIDQAKQDPSDADAAKRLIAADVGELVDYMLFVDEPPLPGAFRSTSGFKDAFERSGVRDRRGRSLKQLDLETRLLRYPCSYMIYSTAFEWLPDATRDAIYARMWDILSGRERDPRYAKLTPQLRADIVDILLETKPRLPAYFQRLP